MKKTIFFIHGMGGSEDDWRALLPLLEEAYQVKTLHLHEPASIDEALEQLLAQLDIGSTFDLCGYSMGGRLSILLSCVLKERGHARPENLFLLSTGLGFEKVQDRETRVAWDEKWVALAQSCAQDFWQKWYEQDLFQSFHQLPAVVRDVWLERRKRINFNELQSQLLFLSPARHDYLYERLRQLQKDGISALYIVGELDKKYLQLANTLSGINTAVVAGAGHILPLEAPEKLAALIKNKNEQERGSHGNKHR